MRRAPLGDVLGPVPLWTLVAVGVSGLVGRGSVGEGPKVAVERSLPALIAELISPAGAGLLVAAIGAVSLLALAHLGRGRDQLGVGVDVLAQQHARVVLDVDGIERLGPGGPAARSTEWVRDRVRTAATRRLDERTGGLLVGFVTGDTRLLPSEDRAAMQATALTHLTGVSGQSVREQGALAERPRPGDRLPGSVLPVVMASLGHRPPSPAPTRASRQAHVHLIILTPRGGLEPHCPRLMWRPTATPGSASRARGVSSSARGHSSGIHRVIGRCGLIARRCRSSRGLAARSQPSPADLLTGGRTVPA